MNWKRCDFSGLYGSGICIGLRDFIPQVVHWAHLFLLVFDYWSELEGPNRLCSCVWLLGASSFLHVSSLGFSPLAGLGLVNFSARRLASKKQDKEGLKTRLGAGTTSLLLRFVAQKYGTRAVEMKGKRS